MGVTIAEVRWHISEVLELSIPSHLYDCAEKQRSGYSDSFTGQFASEDRPTLPIELCSGLLCHIAGQAKTSHRDELVDRLWDHLDSQILRETNVHSLVAAQTSDSCLRQRIIRTYFDASVAAGAAQKRPMDSNLPLRAGVKALMYGVFGGQGNTRRYFDEIRSVIATYRPLVIDLLEPLSRHLRRLAQDGRVSEQYKDGLDVMQWLLAPESTPPEGYLLAAPVSFPLIGLLQLLYVKVTLISLGLTPAEVPNVFRGLSGHSQGVVVACAVATVSDWHTFQDAATKAVTILFWIGARCQQVFSEERLSPQTAQQFQSYGYDSASAMLSVSGIRRSDLESAISRTNKTSHPELYVVLALVNTESHFVVSGPERSLGALIRVLETAWPKKASPQARIPYSQRKSTASMSFLPVTIPCHSALLDAAIPLIEDDLSGYLLPTDSLRLPVNMLLDGSSVTGSASQARDLIPKLIRMVVSEPVNWLQCDFEGVRKILDFGPGAASGVGALTRRNVRKAGTRVIVIGRLAGKEESELGSFLDLFSNEAVKSTERSEEHRVSVVRTAAGQVVASSFTRLFGLPPFLVAGMTPTTTHPEFVAAVMKAGYPVEFAAGGYNDGASLRSALYKLRDMMPAGRTITINIIYVSPKALAWQIPLIRQLRAEGFPLSGMTVGGGIPSLEVATDYIETLGLEHISFKPGSVVGIRQVIEIASRIRPFPVILQWTGGRGGGHHSAEDFHAPLLETYAAIRTCENIILVAGSGFGCIDDATHYLTGAWSLDHGQRLRMPIDGILFGSRVMACAEAHTSEGVKAEIAAASGVDDLDWEGSYQKAVGGVISIVSEMGESMHVIANRGSQLWAELDKSVFSVEKSRRVAALAKRKAEIIARLNADYQKPWFGEKSNGRVCDVSAMTYGEILQRLARLTFIKFENRWVDESYSRLFADWLRRVEARFAGNSGNEDGIGGFSLVDNNSVLDQDPAITLDTLLPGFSDATNSPLYPEDYDYFIQLCSRPGQKPVPFIPVLDENFERWFKKDSLWQSEQLAAVIDQDGGRVLILHGPVAARHTRVVNEPVGEVLDRISNGVTQHLIEADYNGDESQVPFEEFLWSHDLTAVARQIAARSRNVSLHGIRSLPWAVALVGCRTIIRGPQLVDNPIRKLFDLVASDAIEITERSMSLYERHANESTRLLLHISKHGKEIQCLLYTHATASGQPVSLNLRFEFHPETSWALIWECLDDREERIRSMYSQLWHPVNPSPDSLVFEDRCRIEGSRVKAFNRATGARLDSTVSLDFAIVPAWRAICGALLHYPTQGDLLNLVHLSNTYEADRRIRPINIDDDLVVSARVTSVTIEDVGKTIEVACELRRAPTEPILLTVLSRFLYRGIYTDFDSTFTRKIEPEYQLKLNSTHDIAILDSKSWFRVDNGSTLEDLNLPNALLQFHCQTHTSHTTVSTSGKVFASFEDGRMIPFGTINHSTSNSGHSPVVSYLRRRGRLVDSDQAHRLSPASPSHISYVRTPVSNTPYSVASGDFNPIHTSPSFAKLAGLPGTITHGMYCSAAVRQALEKHIGRQEHITRYHASFVGMVLPDQLLKISIRHTAMHAGLVVYDIEVQDTESGTRVLTGSASATQPATTLVFTGQGSQERGMGLNLYASSSTARAIWDRADAFFLHYLGVSILDVVRDNPKEIKVHFGGVRGRELRCNYISMQTHVQKADGKLEPESLFPTVGENSMDFTHASPKGLLFATQFAQPALAIMEMAAFRDMQASGVIDMDFRFTGHSLGEWVALACGTDFLSFEDVLKFFFYRGMTMQCAVERDALDRSDFSMIAVDPIRMGEGIDESSMHELVLQIKARTGWFIEIVNFNIRNSQYVCAGDSRALDLVQKVADGLKTLPRSSEVRKDFAALIMKNACTYDGITASEISLQRGSATIPLVGMDVPFHSSKLRPKMQAWKHMLEEMLGADCFQPSQLVGRYIPNVTGTPFSISKDFFEEVWAITRSDCIKQILDNWDDWMKRVDQEKDCFSASCQLTLQSSKARQLIWY